MKTAMRLPLHPLNEHRSLAANPSRRAVHIHPDSVIPPTACDAHKASKRRFVAAALWHNSRWMVAVVATIDSLFVSSHLGRQSDSLGRCIEASAKEESYVEEK